MIEEFKGRPQNKNEYDAEGEVVLDEETRLLYKELEDKSISMTTLMMHVQNRVDKLNPDNRKKIVKELNSDLDALLAKMKDVVGGEYKKF